MSAAPPLTADEVLTTTRSARLHPGAWRPCPGRAAESHVRIRGARGLDRHARGLGTCWTNVHLLQEEEAEILGIPFAGVQQAALTACAHTRGTRFGQARREPLDRSASRELR